MTRTMYDSVTMANIYAGAQMVAFYVDGRYANGTACRQRFPNAIKVGIAVFPSTNDGVVLDCETGDATPAQCPGWVKMRRAAGIDPTVYCNTATWPWVINAFRSAGVPEPHYWIAAYPGIGAALYPGSVAHQYDDPGPYDVSVVADFWPGVDSKPGPPPPAPKPGQKDPRVTWGVQHAVHLTTDGIWGQMTMDGANAVVWRMTVKYGVTFVQARVGALQDGVWGPVSESLRIAAVAGIQSAIGVTPDGNFGPVSAAAYAAAATANFGK